MVEQNIGTFVTILTGPNQTDQFECCIGKFSSVYGNVTLMKQMQQNIVFTVFEIIWSQMSA